MKTCLVVVGLIVIGIAAYYVVRYIQRFVEYSQPLTEAEIKDLARLRRENEASHIYRFTTGEFSVSKNFKSGMESRGMWYEDDISVNNFPAVAAALLKGKKHEWAIIGIEVNRRVRYFWSNKGADRESVTFQISDGDLLWRAECWRANGVFFLHNHPNPDPAHISCTRPSVKDHEFAEYHKGRLSDFYNTFFFVCERGTSYLYDLSLSPSFIPIVPIIDSINGEITGEKKVNRKLHREIEALRSQEPFFYLW